FQSPGIPADVHVPPFGSGGNLGRNHLCGPGINNFDVIVGKHVDRKSTRLNSSHVAISYAVFCLKKKKNSPSRRALPMKKLSRVMLDRHSRIPASCFSHTTRTTENRTSYPTFRTRRTTSHTHNTS